MDLGIQRPTLYQSVSCCSSKRSWPTPGVVGWDSGWILCASLWIRSTAWLQSTAWTRSIARPPSRWFWTITGSQRHFSHFDSGEDESSRLLLKMWGDGEDDRRQGRARTLHSAALLFDMKTCDPRQANRNAILISGLHVGDDDGELHATYEARLSDATYDPWTFERTDPARRPCTRLVTELGMGDLPHESIWVD